MCAAALLKLQVATIYYGCANDKFGGELFYQSLYCCCFELHNITRLWLCGGHAECAGEGGPGVRVQGEAVRGAQSGGGRGHAQAVLRRPEPQRAQP